MDGTFTDARKLAGSDVSRRSGYDAKVRILKCTVVKTMSDKQRKQKQALASIDNNAFV